MSKEINMNIEVGDYVRSRNGSIGKVTKIEDDKYLYENKELITFIGNVVKHSKNIIDLIEVGDFVNGIRVYCIKKEENSVIRKEHIIINYLYENSKSLYEENIENVLTKEQYSQNCYKVERS